MPFTIDEFRDLVRILEEKPEWRADLRRIVLADELLSLPGQLAELRVHTEQRFQELAEAQKRTEEQITELTGAQQRAADQIAQLAEAMRTLTADVAELKGRSLEADYRTKVYAHFGRLIRRAHVLSPDELTSLLEDAIDTGVLSQDQAGDVSLADVIVQGKHREGGTEVYLVVEVSWGVGLEDVERAVRRAALLAQTGTLALPVVAGKWVIPDAVQLARAKRVWQITDGRAIPPEQ